MRSGQRRSLDVPWVSLRAKEHLWSVAANMLSLAAQRLAIMGSRTLCYQGTPAHNETSQRLPTTRRKSCERTPFRLLDKAVNSDVTMSTNQLLPPRMFSFAC